MVNSAPTVQCGLWASWAAVLLAACLTLACTPGAQAAEYFVATTGSDQNPGSSAAPFQTIQKAADVMQPGDICRVRPGIYREWVQPPRGGTSEAQRITYQAEPGDPVVITGAQPIANWMHQDDGTWRVEIPDTFFGNFNPYKTTLKGEWLHQGQDLHLGAVYLDGQPYRERLTAAEVTTTPGTFAIEAAPAATILHANFGPANPNARLAEINVRECAFFPVVKGLKYITVDGFTLRQVAAGWAEWRAFQRAAMGTYWGRSWIIQNCTITDARCAGIVCGNDASPENEGFDAESVGHHIVRFNHIYRCGEAGIHGYKGWAGSTIESNLIEDINPAREFGGEESGGIKIHGALDLTVRNNVIRRINALPVPGKRMEFTAIWIDWAAQGTRVTGNVVYDSEAWCMFLQNNHGPLLIDNNVFAGNKLINQSANVVFAHNLFVNMPWRHTLGTTVACFKPHTANVLNVANIAHENDRYLNNIFVGEGTDRIPHNPGYQVDWNVFWHGARKSAWGDAHSIVAADFDPGVKFTTLPDGVQIEFRSDPAPWKVSCPLITHDFIGVFALMGQGLEDRAGHPLTLNTDLAGQPRPDTSPAAGPLANPHESLNTLRILAGPRRAP